MDVIFDSSARNAIAFAHFYNSILARNAGGSGSERPLRLHVLRPSKPLRINLLDFEPGQTAALIADGYEDTINHLLKDDCAQCVGAIEERPNARWF
jgi:hypothetical protein